MKKQIIALSVLGILGVNSYAQEAKAGLKIGMVNSEWYGPDITSINEDGDDMRFYIARRSSYDNQANGKLEVGDKYDAMASPPSKRWGFHAGVQINSMINDYFWLKHEFLFATKGFSYRGNEIEGEVTAIDSMGVPTIEEKLGSDDIELIFRSYNVDILPVSLAAHYEGIQLFVGPYLSASIAQSWVDKTNGKVSTPGANDFMFMEDSDDFTTLSSRTLNILDYGFVAGFEYELPFGLNVGVRYLQGFASVLETPAGEARTNAFNKDLRISLGYTFGKE